MSAAPVVSPSLLIATTNPGKFREFSALLADLPITLQSLTDVLGAPRISEEASSYAANARHKAVTMARWAQRATLADDSGLEVDALGGAPGVHSARYAGAEQDDRANVAKLLDALRDVPPAARTARFCCVIAVALPDGATLIAEGSCDGCLLDAPRGHAGFGYDPVFLYTPAAVTFAEMPAAMKNQVSHRARACLALRPQLLPFLLAYDR